MHLPFPLSPPLSLTWEPSRNTIDETKSTFGQQTVDKDIGSNRPEDGASGGRLRDRVDELMSGSGTDDATAAQKKASTIDEEGMKVGAELDGKDQHDLAAEKQP